MLEVGREQPIPGGASIVWRQGDATRLDIPDNTFDLLVCQQGLQFFPDRAASALEMRRVLREAGRAVISVWQGLRQHPIYETLFTATARYFGVPLSDVNLAFSLSDKEELRRLLRDAGFKDVEIFPRSLLIHMPEPERFVQLTVLGAATSIPAFIRLDAMQRDGLIQAISTEASEVVQQFLTGDMLTLSMSANIAVAR